jgi:hypothetical protein
VMGGYNTNGGPAKKKDANSTARCITLKSKTYVAVVKISEVQVRQATANHVGFT